jgi:hypothetical protein
MRVLTSVDALSESSQDRFLQVTGLKTCYCPVFPALHV